MVSEVEEEPSGAARPGRIHLGQSPSNLNGGRLLEATKWCTEGEVTTISSFKDTYVCFTFFSLNYC